MARSSLATPAFCRSPGSRVKRGAQLALPLRAWGGKRAGAGRKPRGARAGVPHRSRPFHHERHPVHVTMRVAEGLPSLRAQALWIAARRAMGRASREWFRLLHFSVQANHVHLVIEASDKAGLSRGMAGLAIRIARAINGELGRKGRVFGDRYHARALLSPREVRRAIVYVLMNHKKHARGASRVDRATSAFWFEGWRVRPRMREPPGWAADDPAPVTPARTWLARVGWRRHGLIRQGERPAAR